MNDRYALSALLESPSFLLRELGVGKEMFLYRPVRREWQFISCDEVDDEVWKRGKAFVFRVNRNHVSAAIRLFQAGRRYAFLALEPDWATEESGRRFVVYLRDEGSKRVFPVPVPALFSTTLLRPRGKDVMLPGRLL